MPKINSYDLDGVVDMHDDDGVYPGPNDVIITGRSFEETQETLEMLLRRGIRNKVFFNPLRFEEKSRVTSGQHKARTILSLMSAGFEIGIHLDDDEIQIAEIKKMVPGLKIVHVRADHIDKENKRHR
jgi:hypothetical protein